MTPPTIIIRHRKENLKKCSLQGLKGDSDFQFYTYPSQTDLNFKRDDYLLLKVDAPPLSRADRDYGLLLLDGTWRYAGKMEENLSLPKIHRSLPIGAQTAYPRRQEEEHGLASIEALYLAYYILGRNCEGLLDHYFWKEAFLEKNRAFFLELAYFRELP